MPEEHLLYRPSGTEATISGSGKQNAGLSAMAISARREMALLSERKGIERIVFHYVPEPVAPPRHGHLLTQAAGIGVLTSAVGLTLDFVLLIGAGLGTALGGSASSGVLVVVVTVAVVLVGVGAGVCGVLGGRRARRLGWVWATCATLIAVLGAFVLYGVITSPSLSWP